MKYRHPVFIATLVFTAAVLLSSSGCFIFGGGGEETSQEPANAQATNTPAGEQNPTSSDEQRLEDSAYDAIETITVAGARGQLVSGSLNWSNGVIQAIGYGIPRPNDSQVLARRNALIAAAADARSAKLARGSAAVRGELCSSG